MGSWKLISPPESLDAADVLYRLEAGDTTALGVLAGGAAMTVTPDPARRFVSRAGHLAAHFTSGGRPHGHGYGVENVSANVCYYRFDVGDRVRAIVLDTVNPHGGWQGSLDEAQLSWLEDQLATCDGRHAVLFSHHPLETLINDRGPAGHRRVLGGELKDALLRHPCVALLVNGHTHCHRVTPVRRESGEVAFWQMTTGSHIDWPQQSRIIELLEAPNGALTIVSTVVDSAGPVRPSPGGQDPLTLASLSRELAANCWQTRSHIGADGAGAGTASDRNVVLTLPPRRKPRTPAARGPAERVADELLGLVEALELLPYGGEPVSQRAHALQSATIAIGLGAPDEVVAAALLHDIGYSAAVRAFAPRRSHERAAATYVQPLLGIVPARLIAHHVAAKRYLVAVDPGYQASLSSASQASLIRQGGPASMDEVRAWRGLEWWPQALLLRTCDDRAKVPGAPVVAPSRLRPILARLAVEPVPAAHR